MSKYLKALAALLLCGSATGAQATIDIGGLDVPAGPVFAVTQVYTNVTTSVGSELSGYGEVDSINSVAVSSLCVGCELTYRFSGYIVSSISPTEVKFTGGTVQFYLGFGADNDFTTVNAGGSAGDLLEATNGTLFLTLIGHAVDAAGNTLVGTGSNIGTVSPTGFASGLLDVNASAGGIANAFFDTNAVPALFGGGNADVLFASSFSSLFPPYPSECTGGQGPACLSGSGNFRASVIDSGVPEPASWAMMLLGFGAIGLASRRQKKTASPRAA
jgi:hypothetical protein